MKSASVFIVVSILVALFSQAVLARCKKDTDCKWEAHLCIEGECKRPPPSKAPEEPLPPGAIRWFRGYFELSGLMNIHTWGEVESKSEYIHELPVDLGKDWATVSGGVAPGLRIAGYSSHLKYLHVGGYLSVKWSDGQIDPDLPDQYSWIPAEENSSFIRTGLGVATKLGFRPANRLFMGLALDFGMHFFSIPTWKNEYIFEKYTFHGLELVPKLVFDIMAIDRESFKLAVTVSAGVVITPDIRVILKSHMGVASEMTIELEDGTTEDYALSKLRFHMWQISPVISIGINLGR